MKVLLVRHAAAVDPEEFKGPDLERPLTPEGAKKARRLLRAVAGLYPELGAVLCSRARRAVETAKILADCAGVKVTESELLNPGCTFKDLARALTRLPKRPDCVAVVGHEPDFSHILSDMVAGGTLRVEVKKASCIEVEVNHLYKGELKAVLPPAVLMRVRK